MKIIETSIIINTSASVVWNILTDFERHPEWNPFIQSISGEKKEGSQLKVNIKPPDGGGMIFKPQILVFQKNREFRWLGKLFIKGIFDGEHYFIIEQKENESIKFIHGEKFSGILVKLFGGMLEKTKKGFQLMNEALKKQCEEQVKNPGFHDQKVRE